MHILLSTYMKKLLVTMKTFVLLTDKTEDETITITFGYVMPTMLALLFISVTCYCVHKYIHIHKQKHPTNLVSVFCCRRSPPTLAFTAELCVFQGSKQAWRKPWLAPNKSSSCHWDQEKKTSLRVIKYKINRVITQVWNDQNRAVGLGSHCLKQGLRCTRQGLSGCQNSINLSKMKHCENSIEKSY